MIKKIAGLAAATLTASAALVAMSATTADAAGDGKVISKTDLTVRHAPSSHSKAVGSIKPGKIIPLNCKVTGTTVEGNDRWYLLPGGDEPEWVSARYVKNLGDAPGWCGNDERFVGKATTKTRVRVAPNTADKAVDTLSKGEGVDIICKANAKNIDGNKRWYWTTDKKWVSARYVDNVKKSPNWCV